MLVERRGRYVVLDASSATRQSLLMERLELDSSLTHDCRLCSQSEAADPNELSIKEPARLLARSRGDCRYVRISNALDPRKT